LNNRGDAHRGKKTYLYVADCCGSSNREVTIYGASSKKNPPPLASLTDGVFNPEGLFADSAGDLYVVDTGANEVTVYPKGSNKPSATYTQDLSFPQDAAVDSKGTLYVTSSSNDLIVEYPNGSTYPSLTFSPPGEPVGLAIDKHDNLYVTTVDSGTIYRFRRGATQGKALPYQMPGSAPNTCGLAFDLKGRLFVTDLHANAVYGFSGKSPMPFETITDGINYPYFRGFAPDGSLYVPNPGANDVTVYAPNSTSVEATFSQDISVPGGVAFLSVK
jgi:serine/threonine-protein kinase